MLKIGRVISEMVVSDFGSCCSGGAVPRRLKSDSTSTGRRSSTSEKSKLGVHLQEDELISEQPHVHDDLDADAVDLRLRAGVEMLEEARIDEVGPDLHVTRADHLEVARRVVRHQQAAEAHVLHQEDGELHDPLVELRRLHQREALQLKPGSSR